MEKAKLMLNIFVINLTPKERGIGELSNTRFIMSDIILYKMKYVGRFVPLKTIKLNNLKTSILNEV